MKLVRCLGAILAALSSGDGVERAADGGPPVAFRIWRAGDNPTDMGVHVFSKRSAALIAADQLARANEYSFDVDHMSLNSDAPIANHAAVGWHRLEVRGGELWAVDVKWSAVVASGLTEDPPAWKYFSPAYDVDKETGEIVGYLNCAVTNNPATWSVTALASRTKGTSMDFKAALAALMGDDDEKKTAARAALAKAAEGDDDDAAKAKSMLSAFGDSGGDGASDDDDKKKEEAKKAAAAKAAADADTDKKDEEAKKAAAKASADDEAKKASRTAGDMLAKVGELDRQVASLVVVKEASDRATIMATRPDLTKSQVELLAKKPVAELDSLLALIPKPVVDPAAAARVQATRGTTGAGPQDFGAARASRLPPAEHEDLRRRMGAPTLAEGVHWDKEHPNDLVFEPIGKHRARAVLASRMKAGLEGAARRPGDANGGAR